MQQCCEAGCQRRVGAHPARAGHKKTALIQRGFLTCLAAVPHSTVLAAYLVAGAGVAGCRPAGDASVDELGLVVEGMLDVDEPMVPVVPMVDVSVPMVVPLVVPVVEPMVPVSAGGGVTGAGVVTSGVTGAVVVSSFLPHAPSASNADSATAVTAADLNWLFCMSVPFIKMDGGCLQPAHQFRTTHQKGRWAGNALACRRISGAHSPLVVDRVTRHVSNFVNLPSYRSKSRLPTTAALRAS